MNAPLTLAFRAHWISALMLSSIDVLCMLLSPSARPGETGGFLLCLLAVTLLLGRDTVRPGED